MQHAPALPGARRKTSSMLEVDDEGGRMFLRVLIHLTMHDYAPLVSGALQLLFKHFSQRQEAMHTFKQVPDVLAGWGRRGKKGVLMGTFEISALQSTLGANTEPGPPIHLCWLPNLPCLATWAALGSSQAPTIYTWAKCFASWPGTLASQPELPAVVTCAYHNLCGPCIRWSGLAFPKCPLRARNRALG